MGIFGNNFKKKSYSIVEVTLYNINKNRYVHNIVKIAFRMEKNV